MRCSSDTKSIPARLAELGYSSYGEYLTSDHWRDVRRRFFASRLPKACRVCGEARVQLHHRTYKNLGRERLTDLIPLCSSCHEGTHKYLRTHRGRKLNIYTAAKLYERSLRPRGKGGRFIKV